MKNNNDISDDELEKILEKELKANETRKANCGKPIPSNREIGVQRTNIKTRK